MKKNALPARKERDDSPLHRAWKIISTGISRTLNPSLLALQGMMLIISIFSFVVFSAFMLLGVFFAAILAIATGFFPIAIFVGLFGIALWLLGMMAINAFTGGVHFHLAMQAATHKPIDLNLAWKLSSARWKDATIIQGCLVAILLTAFVVSTLAVFVFSGNGSLGAWLSQPSLVRNLVGVSMLVMAALLFVLQPFLLLLLPTTYFEDVRPTQIFQRVNGYARPKYWPLFATAIGIILVNVLINVLSETLAQVPSSANAPLSLVVYATIATLIQLGAILFSFTATICIQTTAYLYHGKPKPHTQFVSKGIVSHHLVRMVHSSPHHSGYLPIKWKQPSSRFPQRQK
jgi:hypothetical protein